VCKDLREKFADGHPHSPSAHHATIPRMAFERRWPEEVQRVLVARCLDKGETPKDVHMLALADAMPGIDPAQVPPLGTLQRWVTDARKERQTEERAETLEGHADVVEKVLARAALALDTQAEKLERSGKATPREWGEIAKAAGEIAKARRELERKTGRVGGQPKGAEPAQPDAPASAWLDGLDPDA
jgi:transposase-like protein